MAHNFDMHEAGRIAIIWDPRHANVEVLDVSPQVIHTSITYTVSLRKFYVSFVYGLQSVVERRSLWQSLLQFGSRLEQSWLVLGDFNSVLNSNDRHGHTNVTSYEVRDFMNCCMDLRLVNTNYTGTHFTWTNNETWFKIDREMCNNDWFAKGLNATFFPLDCFLDNPSCIVFCLSRKL